MRRIFGYSIILFIAATCGLYLWIDDYDDAPEMRAEVSVDAIKEPVPKEYGFSDKEVFRRALWRNPDPTDYINEASRREWLDERGFLHWEFFLSLQPGQKLTEWLSSNPFRLRPKDMDDLQIPKNKSLESPEKTAMAAPDGSLVIVRSTRDGCLYIWGSGSGFSKPQP